jgi:preprotein translocase subunit SecB
MSTDPSSTPPEGSNPDEPQLQLQAVYLKDCSFEAPNGPRIAGDWNPQVSLDLQTTANALSPDVHEVVLSVTVGAKLSQDDARRAIGSVCPNVLFPYARSAVSHLVTQGGFPQFLLPPVNFDALYARSLGEAQNPTRQ